MLIMLIAVVLHPIETIAVLAEGHRTSTPRISHEARQPRPRQFRARQLGYSCLVSMVGGRGLQFQMNISRSSNDLRMMSSCGHDEWPAARECNVS